MSAAIVGCATIFSLVCLAASSVRAQSEPAVVHVSTTVPSDARFEIVQSSIAVKGTWKVDRFAGDVYQMVRFTNREGVSGWSSIRRGSHPLDKVRPGTVNYQLFSSGIAMRSTYLMNVNTGATWMLVEGSSGMYLEPLLVED